jgi:16S rRNA (cytidine1402-2'-O)-methyltransferase
VLGDRTVALGRELTKIHEELVVRPISQHLEGLKSGRGEYTLVVFPSDVEAVDSGDAPTIDEMASEFGEMTDIGGLSRRAALRALADKYALPAREVFARLERAKMSG